MLSVVNTSVNYSVDDFFFADSPKVEIFLDLPPEKRYSEFLQKNPWVCKKLEGFFPVMYESIQKKLNRVTSSKIRNIEQLKFFALEWYNNLPIRSWTDDVEYFKEIQGWTADCREFGKTQIQAVDFVIYNWVYEFGSLACTSII